MPTDPNIHPYWAQETKELANKLDSMDYFEVLGVEHDAPLSVIKDQYHALQRAYHPDTFYQSPDTELKQSVFRIAKRVSEAYVILRNPDRREKYLKDLNNSDDRTQKLRYTEESEQEARKEREEVHGKTPQGRTLVQKALQAIEEGDLRGAERDLKTALLFEAGNQSIKDQLEEIRAQLENG